VRPRRLVSCCDAGGKQEESVKVVRTLSATVTSSTAKVDHLQPGAGGTAFGIPVQVHPYSAGLLGGAFGGVRDGHHCMSLWIPGSRKHLGIRHLLAAAALPSLTDAGPEVLNTFQLPGFIVALLYSRHLSLCRGLNVCGFILPMMPYASPRFWEAFFGSGAVDGQSLDSGVFHPLRFVIAR